MAQFPTLHATINVRRTLVHATSLYEGDSGKEQATSWLAAPRVKYELEIEFLDATQGQDMEVLLAFVDAHRGRLGRFTYTDEWDGQDRWVRLDMDDLAYERFMSKLWTITTLTLLTVS
jgi:hypothetical protein